MLGALAPVQADAHEIRPIIATLTLEEDAARVALSMNLEAAIAGVSPEHDDTDESAAAPEYDRLRALPPEDLRRAFRRFAPTLIESVGLELDGRPAPLSLSGVTIPEVGDTTLPRLSEVVLAHPLPEPPRTVGWQLAPRLGDSVLRRAEGPAGDVVDAVYVPAGERAGPLTLDGTPARSTWEVFATYAELGFLHIVPRGLDHILFVIGLFLLSTRLGALLWQISAFTAAHTVTLALGATGTVSLSPAIVEPLIAASIVWIGIENLMTDRLHRWRPVLVFGFGLLHGLGFAGVLGEIGLPDRDFFTGLIAFNIGVELGQLAVVAACFAAVGWAMRAPAYRRLVSVPASLAISAVAAVWVVERTGLV